MNVTPVEVVATVGDVPRSSNLNEPATEAEPPAGVVGNAAGYVNGAAEGVTETVGVFLPTLSEMLNFTVL